MSVSPSNDKAAAAARGTSLPGGGAWQKTATNFAEVISKGAANVACKHAWRGGQNGRAGVWRGNITHAFLDPLAVHADNACYEPLSDADDANAVSGRLHD